ncbi:hypothetical protein [Rossellomorea aquimaris]|uniref:hypothetical protein n=1 Tax=Rossellomorea aquimaris TaxID=189382 RepID=UPI001CFD870E|nr:hypothetical protein [Rossellomorea aquimaris]
MNNVSKARLERLDRLNDLLYKIGTKSEVTPSDYRKLRELRVFIEPAVNDPAVGELAKQYIEAVDVLLKAINLLADNKSAEAEALAEKFAALCSMLTETIQNFKRGGDE